MIPGGSSVPILMPDQIDIPASFDDVQKAGSLLGSAAIMVLDETTDMVWLAENLLHFYRHESCGKCTPCREGTDWLYRLLHRMMNGEGREGHPLLQSVANQINGKTLCAFGDAAATPVLTTLKLFRPEFEATSKGDSPRRPTIARAAAGGDALDGLPRRLTRHAPHDHRLRSAIIVHRLRGACRSWRR